MRGVLTIGPGTVIHMLPKQMAGGQQSGGLVITRGARINAVGTAYNPVLFMVSPVEKGGTMGWSGMVLLGRAPVRSGLLTADQSPTGESLAYGGNNRADSSGVLKHVQIKLPDSLSVRLKRKYPAGVYMLGTGSSTRLAYVVTEQLGKQYK